MTPSSAGQGAHSRPPASHSVYLRRRVAAVAIVAVVLAGLSFGAVNLTSSSHAAGGSTTTTGASGHTSATSSTTTTAPPNPVTISAVGDTMLGNTPNLPPYPATYLQPVEAALKAPIVFGNLEGTLTNGGYSKCGAASTDCYAFRTPPSYALIFRAAGFTVLNSANNHSYDFSSQGVADTSAALKAVGIVQAGLAGQIGIVTEGRTRVAFVDFAPYQLTNNLLDLPKAKLLIEKAKREANIVVVYMHAGAEGAGADHVTGAEEYYVGEDRGNPKVFAHAAIDDGANLVIASGPHVLRGMEYYKGDLIAYSLGDFATYQDFSTSGTLALSGILTVTLSGTGAFQSGHFTSLYLSGDGQPSVDTSGNAAQFVNGLSSADFGTAAATIGANGDLSPPAG